MRTVDRRNCSAISPNPGIAMSFRSVSVLANHDTGFLKRAAAHKLEGERFADGFRAELPVNVFEPRDRVACESDEDVTNNDAGLVCRTVRLNFEDDGSGFVVAFQRSPQCIRQAHRLQTDAKIAARNAALLQKGFDYAIHRRCGNRDGAEARKTGSGNANDSTERVNDRTTDGGGLHADVESNVGSQRGAIPRAPLGDNQADSA